MRSLLGTKQGTIEACITAEQLTSDEREERPDGAGEGEENGSTQKHHMQRLVREGVTKACTERTEGVFLQRVVGVLCTRPADERRDDDEVTCDIGAIGNPCSEGGKKQTTCGRPMDRTILVPSESSATALFTSSRLTSSGTIACQVGAISAAPMPPRKVRPISALIDSMPVWDRT